jgi:pimeloyl-ACP methyl ester carboxylesterase
VSTIRSLIVLVSLLAAGAATARGGQDPLVASVYPAPNPRGLMVTSGGWAYCEQMRPIAQRTGYTLFCARYAKDGYTGPGLRSRRRLDWGNPRYLARLASVAGALHDEIRGRLILIGVSYSGYGVATLASHHPELRPHRLIVIDSYLDLFARRRHLPNGHETAREIDRETGGSAAELRRRSVTASGLARLVRSGTRLSFVWSVSEEERRFFNGATCARDASAGTLVRLAGVLHRPVPVWVTTTRHGVNLWRNGVRIVQGKPRGRRFLLRPGGPIPSAAVCE